MIGVCPGRRRVPNPRLIELRICPRSITQCSHGCPTKRRTGRAAAVVPRGHRRLLAVAQRHRASRSSSWRPRVLEAGRRVARAIGGDLRRGAARAARPPRRVGDVAAGVQPRTGYGVRLYRAATSEAADRGGDARSKRSLRVWTMQEVQAVLLCKLIVGAYSEENSRRRPRSSSAGIEAVPKRKVDRRALRTIQTQAFLFFSSEVIGSHSSTLLPSGSMIQANLPFSSESGPLTISIPLLLSCASSAIRSSTR